MYKLNLRIYIYIAIISYQLSLGIPISLAGVLAQRPSADELMDRGKVYYRNKDLDAAQHLFVKALKIYRNSKDLSDHGQVEALSMLSILLIQQQQYYSAVIHLETLVSILNSSHQEDALGIKAHSLNNLGLAYLYIGEYAKSISVQKQSASIFRRLGAQSMLGRVLLNSGNTYESIGDYTKAKKLYGKSLKIARNFNNLNREALLLSNLGAISSNQGNDQQAIHYFQRSLAIHQRLKHPARQASVLINLGAVYYSVYDLDQALDYYSKGLKLARVSQNRKLEAEVLSDLGLIYEDKQEYSKALKLHQQSIDIAQTLKNPKRLAKSLNNQGHTLSAAKRLKEAASSLNQSIDLLDRARAKLNDRQQISIFDTQLFSYNLLQQILIADNQPEAALVAAEQGRARAFASLLARRNRQSNNSELVQPSPTLDQIRQIAKQQQASIVSYTLVPDDRFKFRGKQRGKASRIFIWVVQPNGRIDFRQVDLQKVTANIELSELVEVARCLQPTPICKTVEEAIQVKHKNSSLKSPFKSHESDIPGLQELYQLLIAPIQDLLPKNPDDRVIFIPHESLFLVPFAALQNPQNQFLIEQHTIASAPSIQVLGFTHQQRRQLPKNQSPSAVIVGNPTMPSVTIRADQPPAQLSPLPHSESEAKNVAAIFKTQPLLGDQATKQNLQKNLAQADYIHLATHGLLQYGTEIGKVEPEIPGAIALAPTANDNGLLTSAEILEQRLKAQLVVLSACDTGRGDITGDGVIGLSRSWLATGIPSVVVSLKAIPDAPTADLMSFFYEELDRTGDKAKALRTAMLDVMEAYPDRPDAWATFMLIGESD